MIFALALAAFAALYGHLFAAFLLLTFAGFVAWFKRPGHVCEGPSQCHVCGRWLDT